jgi:hypothetical protein
LNDDGMLNLLLPVGDFQVTSTFTSIQHERNLEMDYFGISNGIIEQGIIDLELAYTRSLNSDSVVAVDNNSVVNATLIGNNVLTPVVSGEEYLTIEFDLDVEYQGTETSDKLTVSGFVANA